LKKASQIIQEVRSSVERNTSVDELCQSNSMKSSHYSISLAPKGLLYPWSDAPAPSNLYQAL